MMDIVIKKITLLFVFFLFYEKINSQVVERVSIAYNLTDYIVKKIKLRKQLMLTKMKADSFSIIRNSVLDSFGVDKLTDEVLYNKLGEPNIDTLYLYENYSDFNNSHYRYIYYKTYSSFGERQYNSSLCNFCSFNGFLLVNDTVRYISAEYDEVKNFYPKEYFNGKNYEKLAFKRAYDYSYNKCLYEIVLYDDFKGNKNPHFVTKKVTIKNIGENRCAETVDCVLKYNLIEEGENITRQISERVRLESLDPNTTKEITPYGKSNFFLDFIRLE